MADCTHVISQVEGIANRLPGTDQLPSTPLDGLKVGLIEETLGDGVAAAIVDATQAAARHLESLGASVGRVQIPAFHSGLPAYYIIASSEASSNLSRCVLGTSQCTLLKHSSAALTVNEAERCSDAEDWQM